MFRTVLSPCSRAFDYLCSSTRASPAYSEIPQSSNEVRDNMDDRRASVKDDEQLETMGHIPELSRQFSPLSMLGMAFAILNSWTALAASLNLALPSGGSTSVLWGLITAVRLHFFTLGVWLTDIVTRVFAIFPLQHRSQNSSQPIQQPQANIIGSPWSLHNDLWPL